MGVCRHGHSVPVRLKLGHFKRHDCILYKMLPFAMAAVPLGIIELFIKKDGPVSDFSASS